MPFSGVIDLKGGTTAHTAGAGRRDRGPSLGLWKHFEARGVEDPRFGAVFHDDFHTLNGTNTYATDQQNSTGSFALDTTVGNDGIVLADSDSVGSASDGINVQGGMKVSPASGLKIGFEALIKASDINTGPEMFLGLSIIDTSIIASSANTSTEHIGFESVTDDGVLLFHTEAAGSRVSATTPHTLVDGAVTTDGSEWVKLGFLLEDLDTVTIYVNGSKSTATFASTPAVTTGGILVPTICSQTDGTTDSIIHMDWWRIGVTTL
jgi:hypothetical protein